MMNKCYIEKKTKLNEMFKYLFNKKQFVSSANCLLFLHYVNRIFNLRIVSSLSLLLLIIFVWKSRGETNENVLLFLTFSSNFNSYIRLDERVTFGQYSYILNKETILEKCSSKYHNITIAQSGSLRMLRFDMFGFEGVVHIEKPNVILFDYMRLQLLAFLWNSKPDRILFIGLGIGILPRTFHLLSPSTLIDIVELDSMIVDLARKYFSFEDNQSIRIHIKDGRQFLERQRSNQYDMILVDAFTSNGHIPHTLQTLECLGEYQRVLKSNGIVLGNFVYEHESRYRQTYARALFRHVYRGLTTTNFILIGLNKQAQLFNQSFFEIQARILQQTHSVPEMNWLEEIKYLRDGNEDPWNRSATIFTDQIVEK